MNENYDKVCEKGRSKIVCVKSVIRWAHERLLGVMIE
jgi:hypothetical protein